ncbi:hypothetical protein VPH35_005620 [Triticum aestivum]
MLIINRAAVHSHPPTKHNMGTLSSKMRALFYLCFVPCLLLLQEVHAARHGGISLSSQRMALLHWKATLTNPSLQMSSWQKDTSPCNWTGIVCTAVHHGGRVPLVVTDISLPDTGIHGQLDPVTRLTPQFDYGVDDPSLLPEQPDAGVQEPDATVDDDPYYTGGAYYYVQPADDVQE